VPPEAPLAMRRKALHGSTAPSATRIFNRHRVFGCWLARLFVFGGGLALTGYGAYEMYKVVEVGSVTLLKWALLFSCRQFFLDCARLHECHCWFYLASRVSAKPPAPPDALHERTAIVMPIYNEAPVRVFAALER